MEPSKSIERRAQPKETFHQVLRARIDEFVDSVYNTSRLFPSDELYGATSQIRRAVLSVPLNYHEGFGRFHEKARIQFYRISFGSLKEVLYLIDFASRQHYISSELSTELKEKGMKIYGMFWGILK